MREKREYFSMQVFWKNFWKIAKPYWVSEDKWIAWGLLAGVIYLNILQVKLLVVFNFWQQAFYNSLQAFSMRYVLLSLLEFVIILILAIFIFTYINYLAGILSNRWRRWMTRQYIDQWLSHHVAYSMQLLSKKMDNPDQRISQDLSEFPTLVLSLFSGLLNSALTLFSFSIILWELSGNLRFSLLHHPLQIHGFMFWATMVYAGFGTWMMGKLGFDLIGLNYQQEQFNANFRFGLIRVRESSEQIALYQGQSFEAKTLSQLFEPVYKNFWDIILLQKKLGYFVNGYNLMIPVVGILLALPRYIKEKLEFGYLMQVANAFERVVTALSFIVFSFSSIANLRAVTWRLTEFRELMTEAQHESTQKTIQLTHHDKKTIELRQLALHLPPHHGEIYHAAPLTQILDLDIRAGEHVLITGKYGSGKSTLLRALADIWVYGEGKIALSREKTLFLPQKPYFPLGSLKQALLYPNSESQESDEKDQKIQAILDKCGLGYFKQYLDQVRYWPLEFSLGEQQLIAFVRIFLVEPEWVFLDEATSALDEETEAKMYKLLQDTFPRMTIVSVGHRSSLKQFHQKEIYIEKQER